MLRIVIGHQLFVSDLRGLQGRVGDKRAHVDGISIENVHRDTVSHDCRQKARIKHDIRMNIDRLCGHHGDGGIHRFGIEKQREILLPQDAVTQDLHVSSAVGWLLAVPTVERSAGFAARVIRHNTLFIGSELMSQIFHGDRRAHRAFLSVTGQTQTLFQKRRGSFYALVDFRQGIPEQHQIVGIANKGDTVCLQKHIQ